MMNRSFHIRSGLSREICKACCHAGGIGFHVPDEVWYAAVPEKFQNGVLCISCFIRLADEKLIPWDECIDLYPVSMASHVRDMIRFEPEPEAAHV